MSDVAFVKATNKSYLWAEYGRRRLEYLQRTAVIDLIPWWNPVTKNEYLYNREFISRQRHPFHNMKGHIDLETTYFVHTTWHEDMHIQ